MSEEQVKMSFGEIKRQFADEDLLKRVLAIVCEEPIAPMTLYVTLGGLLGIVVGDVCEDSDEVKRILDVIDELIIDAAICRFDRKQAEQDHVQH